MKRYKPYKRLLDLLGVALLSPLLLPVSIVIFFVQFFLVDGSIFFVQERLGQDCRLFNIYKFRTLHQEQPISNWSVFLRMSHLDEIPQLLNILKGEMSFVGPRPLLTEYYPYFTNIERERFKVRPGLTGLAQIKGGNELSWDERLKLDVRYVSILSFVEDIDIILKTFKVIALLEKAESISLIKERG